MKCEEAVHIVMTCWLWMNGFDISIVQFIKSLNRLNEFVRMLEDELAIASNKQ